MKNIIKNEQGVSLVSLAVAIIILGIITSMLLYNIKDTRDIERVSNMYMDIEVISDRVSNYYSRYGALPIKADVTSDSTILDWIAKRDSENNDGPLGKNDTGKFYIIDLSALENISLNYGRGFETDSGNTVPQDKDVYVINANSHNIFYLHGINVSSNSGTKYYYTNQDKDTEKVDIRYVAGIKIPDGFTFKSGTTKNDLKIEDSSKVEYTWANTTDDIYVMTKSEDMYYLALASKPDEKQQIVLTAGQDIDDLITSAKEFGGFYFTPSDLSADVSVNYFSVAEDDNWGMVYDTTSAYTDKNGDRVYIPKGFKISKLSNLNTINKGLVIKSDTTQDEYVWIDVPDDVLANARTLEEIENALKGYTEEYREEGYEDAYYDGCGISVVGDARTNYNTLKNNIYQSIKTNGGFWVSRNEIKNTNSISIIDAYSTAEGMVADTKKTSLMLGIQWDLICKFIEENSEDLTKDTQLNINNLSNEVLEWTLERSPNSTNQGVVRGGTEHRIKMRTSINVNDIPNNIGYRTIIY